MSDGTPGASRRVRHVVLVKFREDATEAERAELVERSQWGRHADYVTGYQCGFPVQPNPYPDGGAWDWGMILELDEADVERYRDDPVHQAVGAAVSGFAERFAVLDFVIE